MTRAIVAADDHPLFRQALAMAAMSVAPDARVVEAGTLPDALEAVRARVADGTLALILLDLRMPGADGYTGIALLHAEAPGVPILVVSSADAAVAAANSRRFGAVGFLGKDADLSAIEAAIGAALAGGGALEPVPEDGMDGADAATDVDAMAARVASLTPMQLRVLLGVLDGRLNKQIAHDLSITEATVKAHMTAVLKKLDVGNRTQAALAARALGLGLTHR